MILVSPEETVVQQRRLTEIISITDKASKPDRSVEPECAGFRLCGRHASPIRDTATTRCSLYITFTASSTSGERGVRYRGKKSIAVVSRVGVDGTHGNPARYADFRPVLPEESCNLGLSQKRQGAK
ncbi:hypothetical protein Bbelb_057350 [Branchiostoma belcheri]|nr:hypothetical protein Bbelb_057350 [Branchiostoma belcheri]